jgi:hypothetical protein
MFPNVRLMIAAVLASVVVLTCGFGIFAAFRVSHEPLGRAQPVGAPMQLVADYTAPASEATGTPNSPDSPAEMSGPQLGANAVNLSLLKPPVPQNAQRPDSVAAGMAEKLPADRHAADQQPASEPEPATFAARIQDVPIQAADPGAPATSDGATDGAGALPQAAAARSAAIESAADPIPPSEQTAPRIKAAAKTSSKSARLSRSGKIRHARSRSHAMSQKSADENAAAGQSSAESLLAQCAAAVERNHGQAVRCEAIRPNRILARKSRREYNVARRHVTRKTAIGGPFIRPGAQ